MNQLSWSLSDEVAPLFNLPLMEARCIVSLCTLIDEKANAGLKYNDLREQLLRFFKDIIPLDHPSDEYNIYRRAYEFAKYF